MLMDNKRLPPGALKHSEMHEAERRFVSGLIEKFQPKNILELGVSAGGGSALILSAMERGATLTSIDVMEKWYKDPSFDVGFAVDREAFGVQWRLITGQEPSEVMDSLAGSFDFCVIDTYHVHPIESMNFLTALPYLSDGAVVVLHDVGVYCGHVTEGKSYFDSFPYAMFACKLLYDTVTAGKIEPPDYFDGNCFSNIGAFQITDDTKKYVRDVFSMLKFPWGIYPLKLAKIYACLARHYDKALMKMFEEAMTVNMSLLLNGGRDYDCAKTGDVFNVIRKNKEAMRERLNGFDHMCFYGGGAYARSLLDLFAMFALRLPGKIWAINHEAPRRIAGVPVTAPKFDALGRNDCLLITNSDPFIASNVQARVRTTENCFTLKEFGKLLENCAPGG
ncbi:MAG: class I SAM-dependent methyltransferase [Gracilibacteraceae bacterium]|jgi:hypothetical protein|nr:class I SAM-dependent methyltransferase [Gracilibacteraceae bacterium]